MILKVLFSIGSHSAKGRVSVCFLSGGGGVKNLSRSLVLMGFFSVRPPGQRKIGKLPIKAGNRLQGREEVGKGSGTPFLVF